MAQSYPVSGPCIVSLQLGETGSWLDLGYTTNDDMLQVSFSDFAEEVTSTASGDEVVEVIDRGRMATITGALNHYDVPIWEDFFEAYYLSSNAIGARGDIGVSRFTAATKRSFKVRLTPTLAGKTQWEFLRCYVPPGDSLNVGPLGATQTIARFVFRAVPVNGVLYTKSTTS